MTYIEWGYFLSINMVVVGAPGEDAEAHEIGCLRT